MNKIIELININITYINAKENLYKFVSLYLEDMNISLKTKQTRKKQLKIALGDYSIYLNKDFSWEDLNDISENLKQRGIFNCFHNYLIYLLENNLYKGNYRNYLLNNLEIFKHFVGSDPKVMFYKGSKPEFFYITQFKSEDKISKTRFNLNTVDVGLRKIGVNFIENELSDKEKSMTRFKIFMFHLPNSFKVNNYDSVTIYDFNYKTFEEQYNYYKNVNMDDGHKGTNLLIRFYIYLLKYITIQEIKHNIFDKIDGIDIHYLEKHNFDMLYDNGFRVVYLNQLDKVPNIDKWLVAPNGAERKTISRKANQYNPIDFSNIKSNTFKQAIKSWYWYSEKSIFSRDKCYYIVMKFIEFILKNHKKINENNIISMKDIKTTNKQEYNITTQDIIQYRRYIISQCDNSYTRNSRISAVKSFLSYCHSKEILDIEITLFDYLKGFKKDEVKPNPILKEDLDLIIQKYKELESKGKLIDKLRFYIVYLCLTTSLRPNEVLKLERGCLIENMKKNQFSIRYMCEEDDNDDVNNKPIMKLLRKGGSGEYREKNIDKYTEKIIRKAIQETEEISQLADKSIKNYIFLYKKNKTSIKAISDDNISRTFKRIVRTLPLSKKDYTFYNLRDTFMTNIYDVGKKNGVSLEQIHMATDHKSIVTTIKHYRDSDIKKYLEAFYGLKIGDIELKGDIAYSINEKMDDVKNIKEITVSDSCGFCKKKGCGESYNIDCLICKSFITTIDRMPFFNDRIEKLDSQIQNETIEHEKEHLVKIKQILVGYVEQLYLLKNKRGM